MLKRNNLVIKLFLALYLVSIYVEYMYMCVHMCIMNLHVHGGAYAFRDSLVIWDCYHPKVLIRRIDYIYNHYPCDVSVLL